MFGKTRRSPPEQVEPDLPITPMLDMSFQLMAFFIFTFRPAPTEGQIAMSLPKEEGGETSFSIPSIDDDKPVKEVVKVQAADNGTIADISIIEEGSADITPTSLGADLKKYQAELESRLKRATESKKKAKLVIEIDDKLLHEYVVQLLDHAMRAKVGDIGYDGVAPVPMDPSKR
jgi:biopolymer transport protein ExbD